MAAAGRHLSYRGREGWKGEALAEEFVLGHVLQRGIDGAQRDRFQ